MAWWVHGVSPVDALVLDGKAYPQVNNPRFESGRAA